eukprot:TRINITY_DN1556_c0_g1_i2.p1 TRINITY_DN1556_c0_g1~~TRINITY_DN1556_c0_g1_i2.p1  ORF type:complete len:579 (+),score=173.79 TRINITY_DN1556_c0_g1_i2:56-1738(+)
MWRARPLLSKLLAPRNQRARFSSSASDELLKITQEALKNAAANSASKSNEAVAQAPWHTKKQGRQYQNRPGRAEREQMQGEDSDTVAAYTKRLSDAGVRIGDQSSPSFSSPRSSSSSSAPPTPQGGAPQEEKKVASVIKHWDEVLDAEHPQADSMETVNWEVQEKATLAARRLPIPDYVKRSPRLLRQFQDSYIRMAQAQGDTLVQARLTQPQEVIEDEEVATSQPETTPKKTPLKILLQPYEPTEDSPEAEEARQEELEDQAQAEAASSASLFDPDQITQIGNIERFRPFGFTASPTETLATLDSGNFDPDYHRMSNQRKLGAVAIHDRERGMILKTPESALPPHLAAEVRQQRINEARHFVLNPILDQPVTTPLALSIMPEAQDPFPAAKTPAPTTPEPAPLLTESGEAAFVIPSSNNIQHVAEQLHAVSQQEQKVALEKWDHLDQLQPGTNMIRPEIYEDPQDDKHVVSWMPTRPTAVDLRKIDLDYYSRARQHKPKHSRLTAELRELKVEKAADKASRKQNLKQTARVVSDMALWSNTQKQEFLKMYAHHLFAPIK